MTDVRVAFTKYDGSLHWHETLRLLGTDGHGLWLGSPAGARIQRGSEPPITLPQAHVELIPAAPVWWSVVFNGPQEKYVEIYCDISTVPVRTGNEITMVDLDLDVIRRWDSSVEILDEDEFLLHQAKYGYSPSVIAPARTAADELAEIIRSGAEPFATAYKPWLAMVS